MNALIHLYETLTGIMGTIGTLLCATNLVLLQYPAWQIAPSLLRWTEMTRSQPEHIL